ncbi:MAG: CAP domain-containing protein [Myxococcota bacterium]|nr:CAP domain-containing protein [Myxococcota bacterium]
MLIVLLLLTFACRDSSDKENVGNVQEGVTQDDSANEPEASSNEPDSASTDAESEETEVSEESEESDDSSTDPTDSATEPSDEETEPENYSDPLSELCHSDVVDWPSDWFLFEREVLEEVNIYRQQGADCGALGYFEPASPLTMNPDFRCASRYHSIWMSENTYTHNSPEGDLGEDPQQRLYSIGYDGIWGENIYAAPSQPSTVVSGWMASDENCATIMAEWWNVIGVGYYYDPDSTHEHYWTQKFGFQE